MSEVEAPLPEGVACERTYQIVIDDKPQPLLCRWFVPEPHPEGGWECRGTIVMADGHARPFKTCGVDSVQALTLALERVSADLLDGDIPAYWFEEDDDLGLPYMDLVAGEVVERKARFDARKRDHRLWRPVFGILSTDWDPFVRSSTPGIYEPYVRELIARLEQGELNDRIAQFLGELRRYIDGGEAFESDAATDLVVVGKLRALVEEAK